MIYKYGKDILKLRNTTRWSVSYVRVVKEKGKLMT